MKRLLCDGWSFAAAELGAIPDDAAFRPVDIPHDFLIGDTHRLYKDCDGWYKRMLPPGEHVLIFDGVYMDAQIFQAGKLIGEWKYGYTPFSCKVSGGEVRVRARNQAPNSRWYSGAGIFRDVWIKDAGEGFIEDGLYVSARREGDAWYLAIDTEQTCAGAFTVRHSLCGNQIEGGARQEMLARGVEPWSPDRPTLYELKTELIKNQNLIDTLYTRVGFREIGFDPVKGFLLNGERVQIRGVCEHHDLGALGAAFNEAAARRRLKILKSMGVNALRTAHNPPARRLLDLCDEMGLIVMDEIFDMWELQKTEYDYARFFKEWHERDVDAWIRRDRNHPCVVLFSIGNEIYDMHKDARGQELTRELHELVRAHDKRMNAGIAFGCNYMPWENAQKCAQIMGIVGYNYAERLYEEHHAAHPDWVIFGSETASLLASRGVYHFPLSASILAEDDLECSALGNSAASWGAKSLPDCLRGDENQGISMGMFLWSGFDYIGEPTPYHTKGCYFGQIDTAGFPKDAYYFWQSVWTSAPMAHILPFWDWNEGQEIDVRACCNTKRVRITLNGRTLLEKENSRGEWNDIRIPYEKGVLAVEGLDEDGNVLAREERRSFGNAARLVIAPESETFIADGRDMAFIAVSCEDENGNPVENANDFVNVRISGPARLVGMDNGDGADDDYYTRAGRRLFSGKLLIELISTGESGEVTVNAFAEGLESARCVIRALPCGLPPGVSAAQDNAKEPYYLQPVFVRRLDMKAQRLSLTPDCPETLVTARMMPDNAKLRKVLWRAATAGGLDAPFVEIIPDGLSCRVRAKGDGEFILRCQTDNGLGRYGVISMLTLRAAGFGKLSLDPYTFVSAGLCTIAEGDLGAGNERGVAVQPGGKGMFGFENVDFGIDGSDEMTLSVFALSSDPVSLSLYDGDEKLMELPYQKPMIWNVYQEETYRLPKVLRGAHTLKFESANRLHVKGFVFARQSRAFRPLSASEADEIYGDAYTRVDGRLVNIGNNVSVVWKNLDFSKGTEAISVSGRCDIPNTLRLSTPGGSAALEFPASPQGRTLSFAIPRAEGTGDAALLFLPGSKFDFYSIMFDEVEK